jgi:hypothetical protein
MSNFTVRSSWLYELPSWVVVVALVGAMAGAAEIGYRLGHRQHARMSETGRGHFGAVQASLLALLALLLGFTFSLADRRYEARRRAVMDDAITLAGLDLRSNFLPNERRKEFKKLFREYVSIHASAVGRGQAVTPEKLTLRAERAEACHRQMCDVVRAEVQGEHPAKGTEVMVSQLSDALAIHRRWVTAFENHVPESILVLLFGAAVAAAGVVGYSGGLGRHRGVIQSVLLTLFVSAIIYVIHDLDTPLSGGIQIDQGPILHLKQLLDDEGNDEMKPAPTALDATGWPADDPARFGLFEQAVVGIAGSTTAAGADEFSKASTIQKALL